jgi:hypothetical protein
MPPQEVTACSMALGFGDAAASVNRMCMPRQRVHEFARFAGFAD